MEGPMNTLEKKLLSSVDKHLPLLTIIAVSILSVIIRFSLRHIVSLDVSNFLLPWFNIISQNGLYEQVGDYNLLYQFLIWIMTKLPFEPLYSYKILSCLGDYLLAILAALLVREIDNNNQTWNSIWAYTAILLCPICFINSAAWAQCDALFTSFAVLGLYLLMKEQYNRALIALGISFAFKLHAVFILPVFLFVYYSRRHFSVLRFILVPVAMLSLSLPLVFWGRNPLETISVYFNQISSYPNMALNYPSFWTLLCNTDDITQYVNLRFTAVLFTFSILAFIMVYWVQKNYSTAGKNLLIMAFILCYTCVLFLPSMHERYGFLYEMIAIILAVLIPKTFPLCLGLLLMSLRTYGSYLFEIEVNLVYLSILNLAIYVGYLHLLNPELELKENQT